MRVMWALVVFLTIGWATIAAGDYRIHPRPLSDHWPFGERIPQGVMQWTTTLRARWIRNPTPQVTKFHRLEDGKLQMRNRRFAITFDEHGRVTEIVSEYRKPARAGQPSDRRVYRHLETAEYDANGVLVAVQQQLDDQPPTMLKIDSVLMSDGGRKYSWANEFLDSPWVTEMTLDANGRIARLDSNPPGATPNPPTVYERNAQGDIEKITQAQSIDLYEYVYDEKGNWTSRTRFTIRGQEKEEQETWIREIEYGEPGPPPEGEPLLVEPGRGRVVVQAKRPQPAPNTPPPPHQAGAKVYQYEIDRRDQGFLSQMTLILNPDHTAYLTIYTKVSGPNINTTTDRTAVGSWTDGETIRVVLEKSTDGEALPQKMDLRFTRSADGGLIAQHDQKMVFKPVEGK